MAIEIGFTHVALPVDDIDCSIAFYKRWAGLQVIDRLEDPKTGAKAARMGDAHTTFAVALVQTNQPVEHRLAGMGHLGVGLASRDDVDRLSKEADEAGCLHRGPVDSGYPLGYWSFLRDPDGHQLELSYGQNTKDA
jgi:catechol 2,3-dioxygenase-like lactoylglutathione lyase family enzyme